MAFVPEETIEYLMKKNFETEDLNVISENINRLVFENYIKQSMNYIKDKYQLEENEKDTLLRLLSYVPNIPIYFDITLLDEGTFKVYFELEENKLFPDTLPVVMYEYYYDNDYQYIRIDIENSPISIDDNIYNVIFLENDEVKNDLLKYMSMLIESVTNVVRYQDTDGEMYMLLPDFLNNIKYLIKNYKIYDEQSTLLINLKKMSDPSVTGEFIDFINFEIDY